MKRAALFALVPLAFAACDDVPTQTESERGPPLFEIVDAVNNAGNQHFFFLPPLVPDPIVSGVFDGSLSPVVEICGGTATNPTTGRCQDPLTEFTTSTGLGSETLRVVPEAEHYIANWHTDEFHLDPAKTYRIRVLVSGTELGHADMKPVSGGSMKDAKTQDVIPLRDGRTLAIKFRIEEGAVFVVGSSGGTITAIGGDVTLVLPSGALTEDAGITVEPVSEPPADVGLIAGAVFEFGPDGTVFEQLVQLTIVYDESNLPAGVDEADLVLLTEENDVWDEVPGSTVDVNANTITGSISGFSKGGGGQKVASVDVTPTAATLFLAETLQLTATPKNSAGDPLIRAENWSSSDDAVATVDANGLVTAVATGSATISVKSGGVTGTTTVTVVSPVLQPSELCSDFPSTAIATFEDANLEAAIRAALSVGADDLTCGLISGLTAFGASAGIESLVGMQNLTSLTFLSLVGNSITDISPLSGLTSLTQLSVEDNSVTDISALSGLTSLTRLFLRDNLITDISALSGLTSLTRLTLFKNSITDVSALSGLTSLRGLFISNNSITDVSPLSGLTSLREVQLNNNSITNISPLSGLTSLPILTLDNNSITDISALSGLTSLTILTLFKNSITNISALSGLTSLTNLQLDNNSITDISALSGLTSLRRLTLHRNSDLSNIQPLLDNEGLGAGDSVDLRSTNVSCTHVADLRAKGVTVTSDCVLLQPSEFCSDHPNAAIATFEDANLEAAIRSALGVGAQEDLTCGLISGLTGLATLSAGIESLVGMQNLTSLTFLNLGGDPITDISALSELTSLTVLLLTANSISDISPLSGLTSLTRLSVEDNSVTDISALSRLTGLTQLFLRDNSITDIGVLSGLTSLTRLFLTANSVTDISALSGLTSLTDLSLENNLITDISEPLELPSLIFLRLGDNSITDISALSGFTSLTFLFLIRNSDLSNIQPLLDNEGLGAGDSVDLRSTNVSCVDVAALIGKEVSVESNFSAAELANCSSP